jgi:tRNA-2-methylthio-N6-dimethylallyladenosine synthase
MKKNVVNYKFNQFCYFIRTYGCQANVRDSENIAGVLQQMGIKPAKNEASANLVILNTCAVRENAEKKVFGEIGLLKQKKYLNHNVLLGLCGCMPYQASNITHLQKIKHLDFVFGTNNINMLPQILYEVITHKHQVINVPPLLNAGITEGLSDIRTSKIKASVNIMYGCDKFCSYCIVPYTRGRIRSRLPQDIINEVNNLIKNDYKEITLLGQNVNAYGIDFKDHHYRFADLLEVIAKTNIARIRFSTSNPWNFDKKIIDVMAKYSNIMPHVHLPIQSGSETVLNKMNRPMKINEYISKVKYLRKKIPHCALSTDFIVGFPGETKQQFEQTLNLYKKLKFDNAYTFVYSSRPGTLASRMKDPTPLVTKQM